MKKWLYTIISVLLCLFLLCTAVGCNLRKLYESGDFIYWINDSKELEFEGLSEQGKEKETIIVPKEIDGHEVCNYTNYYWFIQSTGNFESDNLREIYFVPSVKLWGTLIFDSSPKLEKIVFIGGLGGCWSDGCINNDIGVKKYVTKTNELKISDIDEIGHFLIEYMDFYFTNINFMWNFDGAENDGYYWGDFFDYGTKVAYIPDNPKREGYIFGGWYQEAECVNIWNFDTDTLPEPKLNEEGEALYQETRLYAKWYQN